MVITAEAQKTSAGIVPPLVRSKLMQDFRAEMPVSAVGQIQAVADGKGGVTILSRASTGRVLAFQSSENAKWEQQDTGLAVPDSRTFTAALDDQGRLVVASATGSGKFGDTGFTWVEQSVGAGWSKPQDCSTGGDHCTHVKFRRIQNKLWIIRFFIFGPKVLCWAGEWNKGKPKVKITGFNNDRMNIDLSSSSMHGLEMLEAIAPQIFTSAANPSPLAYTDRGSHCEHDLALWNVWDNVPPPFRAVGDYAQDNYASPSASVMTICSVDDPFGQPLTAEADQIDQIWNDRGTKISQYGSVWRMRKPGYLALGDLSGPSSQTDWIRPSSGWYYMVRTDFVAPAMVAYLYNNTGCPHWNTAARVSVDRIVPGSGCYDAHTFYAHPDWDTPTGGMYALKKDRTIASTLVAVGEDHKKARRVLPPNDYIVSDLSVAEDAQGESRIFVLLSDNRLYFLAPGSQSWTCLDEHRKYSKIKAILSPGKQLHVFGITTENLLYHVRQNSDDYQVFTWAEPAIVLPEKKVASFSAEPDSSFGLRVFAVTDEHKLFQVTQEADTTVWDAVEIELPASEKVDEFSTYQTEITVLDENGLVQPKADIKLWAENPIIAYAGGKPIFLSPVAPASFKTNGAGKINVSVKTSSLHTPLLRIWFKGMDDQARFTVEPNRYIQQHLASLTEDELRSAKGAGGEFIIPEKWRNAKPNTPEERALRAVQEAVTRSMSIAVRDGLDSDLQAADAADTELQAASRLRIGAGAGLYYEPNGADAFPTRIDYRRVPDQHWQFDTRSGLPEFRSLSKEQADEAVEETLRALRDGGDAVKWLNDLGDLFNEIISGLASEINCFVSSVANGIRAVITFVIDGVRFAADRIIQFVEEAFELAEAIFSTIKATFKKLFDWLADVFDPTSIKLTHAAIEHVLKNVAVQFLQGALGSLGRILDSGVNTFHDRVNQSFDYLISSLDGSTESLLAFIQSQPPVKGPVQQALSNNFVLNAFLDNLPKISYDHTGFNTSRDAQNPAQSLVDFMGQLATSLQNSQAFKDFKNYLELKTKSHPADGLLKSTLLDLLEATRAVALASVDVLRTVISKLVELLQQALGSLLQMLDEEWKIPVISQVYSSWIGSKLTPLSLTAFIAAGPTNALYTTVLGKAPTEDDLRKFTSYFTADRLLRIAGFRSAGDNVDLSDLPRDVRVLIAKISGSFLCVAHYFSGLLQGILDAIAPLDPAPIGLFLIGGLVGTLRWASACPWSLNPDYDASPKCSTNAQEFGFTTWICNGLTPVVSVFAGINPFKDVDLGAVAAFFMGIMQGAFAGVGSNFDRAKHIKAYAEAAMVAIPLVGKPLRIEQMVEYTEGVSLIALLALDAVGAGTALGLRIAQLTELKGWGELLAGHALS